MSPLLIALLIYLILLIGVVVYALVKGGGDERSGAVTILVAALLTQIFSSIGPDGRSAQGWSALEIDLMVVDVAVFVAFGAIAYRSKKFWPIWAAASQLVAVLTHLAVILNPSIIQAIYVSTQPFWAIPVMAALAVGTRAHQRSLRAEAGA